MSFSRRQFLRASLLLPLASQLALASRQKLLPVQVSPERVTRRLVGLRPYRPAGFRVQAERLDGKTVVHNYGHGGAGITLSWGTSQLAVHLAWQSEVKDYAVLGCGCVGLATARLLQQRGARVTIYAKDLPPHTTSNIAGGQWSPASLSEAARRTPEWNELFRQASQISSRAYQDLVGEEYGVSWMDNYELTKDKPIQRNLFAQARDSLVFSPQNSPFPGLHARRYTTLMVQPAHYLRRLMEDVMRFGGAIEVRNLPDRNAVTDLPEEILINCTGLGSRELFGDGELIPIKGQLSVLLPQPEIDYAYLYDGYYMFPRKDGIILGGSHLRGEESLDFDSAQEEQILARHQEVARLL